MAKTLQQEAYETCEVIWAGVPDSLRDKLDTMNKMSPVTILAVVGGLVKLRDVVMRGRLAAED